MRWRDPNDFFPKFVNVGLYVPIWKIQNMLSARWDNLGVHFHTYIFFLSVHKECVT